MRRFGSQYARPRETGVSEQYARPRGRGFATVRTHARGFCITVRTRARTREVPMGDLTPIAPKLSLLIGMLRSNEPERHQPGAPCDRPHPEGSRLQLGRSRSKAGHSAKTRPGGRQPRLWPTFGSLTHADRLKWLDLIRPSTSTMSEEARAEFEDLRTKIIMRPNEALTQPELSLFNRLVRAAARRGERI